MTVTPPLGYAALVFTGPELWSAHAVFNSNAFPDDLKSIVGSCALRAGLLLSLSGSLVRDIDLEWETLESELLADRGGLSDAAIHSTVPYMAYSDGVQYLGSLYSFLATSKSFLDVYAMLLGKCIGRQLTWSFKKGRVDGADKSGGAIINWLRRSAKDLVQAEELAAKLLTHSESWITSTVDLRDKIMHYSEIPGMTHLSVPLRRFRPIYDIGDRVLPALPDGEALPAFSSRVLDGVRRLVADTVLLLPGVKRELISPERLLHPR